MNGYVLISGYYEVAMAERQDRMFMDCLHPSGFLLLSNN